MNSILRNFLLFVVLVIASPLAAAEPATGFPLKNGDIWVMAGDSITAQHLHSNYFEAFCFARYPRLKFAFRNSGVGGHTIPSTLARFEYDIAAWKPTVVSVELGMNDQGGTPVDKYLENMKTMVDRIRSVNARPVILSASPINNGDTSGNLGGNRRLDEYASALKAFCAQEEVPYADQFHELLERWGRNKPRELLVNSAGALRQLALDESIVGVKDLRNFLSAQAASAERLVSLQGDPVHPGGPGQLMMAAALLQELKAESFVSSVTIDAAGKVAEAKGCKVDGAIARDGGLVFERLDECLPFPIPNETRAVLPLYPTILNLSQYLLKVKGLAAGRYELKINNKRTATLSANELEAGVNLTAFGPDTRISSLGAEQPEQLDNPIAEQGRAILAAVGAKEQLVSQWRGLSQQAHAAGANPDLKTQLAAQTTKVEEADAKIREAAQPQKLKFELTRVP